LVSTDGNFDSKSQLHQLYYAYGFFVSQLTSQRLVKHLVAALFVSSTDPEFVFFMENKDTTTSQYFSQRLV